MCNHGVCPCLQVSVCQSHACGEQRYENVLKECRRCARVAAIKLDENSLGRQGDRISAGMLVYSSLVWSWMVLMCRPHSLSFRSFCSCCILFVGFLLFKFVFFWLILWFCSVFRSIPVVRVGAFSSIAVRSGALRSELSVSLHVVLSHSCKCALLLCPIPFHTVLHETRN